jgi:hydroxymethylglutaryl-CoA synthase
MIGRLGIVVASDLAVYAKGSARPTGGAGSIAILIGPDAPLVFDNIRSTFMDNAYDFYKPVPNSEYPTVDGHLSINVYLNALEQCYSSLKNKFKKQYNQEPMYKDFDYFCFHTPFAKMVQKSFLNLLYQDVKSPKFQ